ncbi:hypothetical protein BT69DRAFT_1276164 [Atractiella rhizophila]|nr:hypothetical protein BT69DRAFT_1276164 [Atractiella rhizophila]
MSAPALPPRRSDTLNAEPDNDEPPPAYTLRPEDTILEAGPSHPFRNDAVRFAPPSTTPQSQSQSGQSGSGGNATGGGGGNAFQPSTTPIPGRPLLHNGNVLILPASYHCDKCNNTGYKAYDPNNPCRRCWDHYSRPYNHSSAPPPGYVLQRPLPSFHSPASSQAQHQRPPQHPHPQPGYPGYGSPALHQQPYPRITPSYGPPPGARVVRAGDPSLGGWLCSYCGGDGTVYGFLLDTRTCPRCGGVGRVFN